MTVGRRVHVLLVLGVLALSGCEGARQPPDAEPDDAWQHRLVAILDYIGSDYGGAVSTTGIIDEFEHQEHVRFAEAALEVARTAAGRAPQDLLQDLEELERACRAEAPPARVEALTRSARRRVVTTFDLIAGLLTYPQSFLQRRSLEVEA